MDVVTASMIYSNQTPHGFRGQILPKGDRYELPRGRRQFSLASLMWLLVTASVMAAFCRWLNGGIDDLVVALVLTVCVWWFYAEKREVVAQSAMTDQTKLCEEVKRWLQASGQR